MSTKPIAGSVLPEEPGSGTEAAGDAAQAQDGTGWRKWYMLAVLTLVCMFAYMDRMAPAMLLQDIKADLKVSDQALGMLSGLAFALFYSTFGIPLARLADRTSRVRLLSACVALWSVMTLLSGLARNFMQLFVARMGVGIGEAACLPAAHSLIANVFPRNHRTLAICIFQSGSSIGTSAGMLLVGILAQYYDWRTSLQVIGIAGIPLALLILLTLREPVRSMQPAAGASEPAGTAIRALLGRRAYLHLVAAYGLGAICTLGFSQWVPTFLVRSFSMTLVEVGAWSGLATVVGGVTGVLGGGLLATWLAPRDLRWEMWMPAISYFLCALLYALTFLSADPFWALLAKSAAVFFMSVGGGVAMAAIQSFAEPHRRATAISILVFVSSILGAGGGPYLVGLLSDVLEPDLGRESLRYAMLIICVVMLWPIAHFLLAARSARSDRVD
jgi:predicted MFS family arabinose efflux permease